MVSDIAVGALLNFAINYIAFLSKKYNGYSQ